MQGLTIIVANGDPVRFETALSIAAANCALGSRSRIFLQGEAAGLTQPQALSSDATAKGVPSLSELLGEAMAVGVEIIACQTGLALLGLSAEALSPGVTTGGLVGLLASKGEDQLLVV